MSVDRKRSTARKIEIPTAASERMFALTEAAEALYYDIDGLFNMLQRETEGTNLVTPEVVARFCKRHPKFGRGTPMEKALEAYFLADRNGSHYSAERRGIGRALAYLALIASRKHDSSNVLSKIVAYAMETRGDGMDIAVHELSGAMRTASGRLRSNNKLSRTAAAYAVLARESVAFPPPDTHEPPRLGFRDFLRLSWLMPTSADDLPMFPDLNSD